MKINIVSQLPFLKNRMDALEHLINKQIDRIENDENNDLLDIYHLYYDDIYANNIDL